jgi:hypothetical protein
MEIGMKRMTTVLVIGSIGSPYDPMIAARSLDPSRDLCPLISV